MLEILNLVIEGLTLSLKETSSNWHLSQKSQEEIM
jgi:hypothetical protein